MEARAGVPSVRGNVDRYPGTRPHMSDAMYAHKTKRLFIKPSRKRKGGAEAGDEEGPAVAAAISRHGTFIDSTLPSTELPEPPGLGLRVRVMVDERF